MDIEILELTETKVRFILSGATSALVNSLRRTLLADIPKMAINKVEFHLGPIMVDDKEYESVTPLFDEIVSHRLGLVPVPTDLEIFNFRSDCTCEGEGCPNCTIMYSLNKHGPCTVYSGDLEVLGPPEYRVKDELIPIVKLREGQAVLIYATAELGTAREHVKWQVANGVGYKNYPVIDIDQSKVDSSDDYVATCPRGVFGIEDGQLKVIDETACNLCMACVESFDNGAVTIGEENDRFIFQFETDGSMTAGKTLMTALEILESRFEDFRDQVSSLDS